MMANAAPLRREVRQRVAVGVRDVHVGAVVRKHVQDFHVAVLDDDGSRAGVAATGHAPTQAGCVSGVWA